MVDEPDWDAVLGYNCRVLREMRRLSQVELAEVVGVGVTTIVGVERGTRHARMDTITALARTFGVTPAQLLTKYTEVELIRFASASAERAKNG